MCRHEHGNEAALSWTGQKYSGNNDVNRIKRKAHKNKYHPNNIK